MPTPPDKRFGGENYGWFGYKKEDDKVNCTNCGGQTMFGVPTGKSFLRSDSTPCIHEYDTKVLGRCWTKYVCRHCGYSYDIDSSD